MTIGTAGRKSSMLLVKSLNGNGKRLSGSDKNAPVIAGSARYTAANAIPSIAPMLNTRHRQVSAPFDASASAVTPCAPTRAIGNGSFSTSLVSRYITYPSPKLSTREMSSPTPISATGTYHAGGKKLRSPSTAGDDGATHDGILSAIPNCRIDSL